MVGDIQSIEQDDASFDTVISCETIEHVAEPRKAVKELARVLKPGGRLLLTTPNYLGVYGFYRAYMRLTGRRYTEEGQPINNFMLLPLTRALVARSGLRVNAVDAVGHYLLLPRRQPRVLTYLDNPRTLNNNQRMKRQPLSARRDPMPDADLYQTFLLFPVARQTISLRISKSAFRRQPNPDSKVGNEN